MLLRSVATAALVPWLVALSDAADVVGVGSCGRGGGEERCAAEEEWEGGTSVCERGTVITREKVFVVADVHGDLERFVDALQMAGLLGHDRVSWIGGAAVLVQTGDVIDRGPDSYRLFTLLAQLEKKAREAGGCLVQLLGNHEILNMAGEMQYAHPQETLNFGGMQARKRHMDVGSPLGDRLRSLPLVAKIVQEISPIENVTTVFAHAGIAPWVARDHTLEEVNTIALKHLEGTPQRELRRIVHTNRLFLGQGPIWTRMYALRPEAEICSDLDETLELLQANRMIVGHTVQEDGTPTILCNERLVLADTGMSSIYGGGYSLVELSNKASSQIVTDF